MRKFVIASALLAATLLAASSPHSGYHVARRITLGGEGGWDYLTFDPAGKRLFISRGTHVMVVDPYKGTVLGDIPNTPGVHGIALAQDLGQGFTSNGRENTVTVFDLKTLKETARIKIEAENPDAILYDAATKRVFTFNGRSKNATAIDAVKDTVIGNIPLTGKPEFAAADGKGLVFVNIEDRSEIMAFDARTLNINAHWPIAPCTEPSGLAIDREHQLLFSGCDNELMAITNIATGRVMASLPIGKGVDATAYDPATLTAFSSNGEGTLTVVKGNVAGVFTVFETVPTQKSARTMALDERTHKIYTVAAEFGAAPAATADTPRPRPPMVPGSFVILVLEP